MDNISTGVQLTANATRHTKPDEFHTARMPQQTQLKTREVREKKTR